VWAVWCSACLGCTARPLPDEPLARGARAALQPGSPASQGTAPHRHPAGEASPGDSAFPTPNLRSAAVLLYGDSCLMLQSLAGDGSWVPGDITGWAGTKRSSNRHCPPQSTKNAPEHRQNPTAFRRPLRNGISERVVSALLKQSHCGRGRFLINSFLSLISIFSWFPFQLGWVEAPPRPACVPVARCHWRSRSVA